MASAKGSTAVALNAKAIALLEPFNGRWSLDLKRSDPVTPMLEALKTPYLLRKMAASLNVEQTIRVVQSDFEMKNITSYGSTSVVHVINGGAIELKDSKGETTVDDTTLDEDGEYPIIINAILPQNKGTTRDSRRVKGDEMEQLLEFRLPQPNSNPIVMRRFWNRLDAGSKSTASISSSSGPEVTLRQSQKSEKISVPTSQVENLMSGKAVSKASRSNDFFSERPTEDWPSFLIVVIFATSAWYRESYAEGLVWMAMAALLRTGVLFPRPQRGGLSEWWSMRSARFSATAVTMLYATRVILFPIANDTITSGLEALVAVGAYLWTRRSDLAQFDMERLFSGSAVTGQSAWVELSIVGVVLAAILGESGVSGKGGGAGNYTMMDLALAGGLYLFARYRIQIIQSRTSSARGSISLWKSSRGATAASIHVRKRVATSENGNAEMSVHVTQSRVAKYARRPFAQYLVEISSFHGDYAVWCRYRDLKACRDAIAQQYASSQWGEVPRFPGKQWDSISDAVVAQRQVELDAFFSCVFKEHALEIAANPGVSSVLRLDEPCAKQLRDVHDATRRLFTARHVCEEAVEEGESAAHGWLLTDAARREYSKVSAMDGRCMFKRVGVAVVPPMHALETILTHRTVWDRTSTSEETLAKLNLSPDDWERAFSGTSPLPGRDCVYIKRVIRTGSSLLAFKPHDLILFQVVLSDTRSGRLMVLETAAGERIEDELAPESRAFRRIRPLANGFVLEPFATNRTKMTSFRDEDFAAMGFRVPSF